MTARLTRPLARVKNLAIATGVLACLGGLVHGMGEVQQGNHPTGGLGFES